MRSVAPAWRGYTAALCALAYGVLAAAWVLGLPGYPWGTGDPSQNRPMSALGGTTPQFGWWIAAFFLVAAGTALALARGGDSRVPLFLAWPIAVILILVVPDSRLMMGVAYTPLMLALPLFGGDLDGRTIADVWPWPVVNQLLPLLCGLLLAAAALAYDRRQVMKSWFTPRRGRTAVYVAVAVPLFYCVTRWAWALDIPLGVTSKFLRGSPKALWLVGAYLATFGALGGVLTLGLVQRWGEIFPRWIPFLRGRRVPPMLAVIPASTVSIIITVAGLTYLRLAGTGVFTMELWAAWLPECFWPIWGAALGVATVSYHLRRRNDPRREGDARTTAMAGALDAAGGR